MVDISEKELDLLSRDIDRQGLTYTRLKNELLDHICCNIESYMREGLTFNEAYRKVKREMGSRRITQVQDATLYLINQKYRRMKKTMLLLGIFSAVTIIIGTVFKMLHWPASGILLTLGLTSFSLAFLPLFMMVRIRDTREKKKKVNRVLLVTGLMAGILFSLGSLLKVMHWPGANVTLGVSLIAALVFLILFLVNIAKDKSNWIENFTYIMLIAMFFAFVNLVYVTNSNSKIPLIEGLVISEGSMGIHSGYLQKQSEQIIKEAGDLQNKEVLEHMIELKSEADQICAFISSTRLDIVRGEHENNKDAISDDDRIDYQLVIGKASGDEVYRVLFGENREGKAKELKLMLENYKEHALLISQNETTRSFIRSGLEMEDYKEREKGNFPKDRDDVNWEESRFLYCPLVLAANNLSQVEEFVRLVELEVLRETEALF